MNVWGGPDWKRRQKPANAAERVALQGEIQAVVGRRSLAEWLQVFESENCCVTPTLRLDEALEHPQAKARGMVVAVSAGDGILLRQLPMPVKMTGYELTVHRMAPEPGEHTQDVLYESGWCADDVQCLRASGAID